MDNDGNSVEVIIYTVGKGYTLLYLTVFEGEFFPQQISTFSYMQTSMQVINIITHN